MSLKTHMSWRRVTTSWCLFYPDIHHEINNSGKIKNQTLFLGQRLLSTAGYPIILTILELWVRRVTIVRFLDSFTMGKSVFPL